MMVNVSNTFLVSSSFSCRRNHLIMSLSLFSHWIDLWGSKRGMLCFFAYSIIYNSYVWTFVFAYMHRRIVSFLIVFKCIMLRFQYGHSLVKASHFSLAIFYSYEWHLAKGFSYNWSDQKVENWLKIPIPFVPGIYKSPTFFIPYAFSL